MTIAILNLESRFRHYAAPVLEPAAYLQALTTNTSEYMLLASDKVNVFLGACAACWRCGPHGDAAVHGALCLPCAQTTTL